jgi:hypothetical protein
MCGAGSTQCRHNTEQQTIAQVLQQSESTRKAEELKRQGKNAQKKGVTQEGTWQTS